MNRAGNVFIYDQLCGRVYEDDTGYTFQYNSEYLLQENAMAISFTLPLQKEVFVSKTMFPFFDGLIPEGWLLTIAEENWKLDSRDRMGLLLACCKDCIGAVSVVPIKINDDEL